MISFSKIKKITDKNRDNMRHAYIRSGKLYATNSVTAIICATPISIDGVLTEENAVIGQMRSKELKIFIDPVIEQGDCSIVDAIKKIAMKAESENKQEIKINKIKRSFV